MKAHRRIAAAAAMALSVALVAGPAYASNPPDIKKVKVEKETNSSPRCYWMDIEGDREAEAFGLGLIGVALANTEVLTLEGILNCSPILSDLDVLSNDEN